MTEMDRQMMMDKIREAFEKHSENVACESCQSTLFDLKTRLKRVSPLMSPTGHELLLPGEVYICTSCGHELQNPLK